MTAVERDVPVEVFGLGTIEARIVSQIGFQASGALVELNADEILADYRNPQSKYVGY